MDNFFKRVVKAQAEIKAPKGQRNTFGNYNYRSCEDILEAAKPVCATNGLLLTITDKLVLIGDRYYVEATARLIDTDGAGALENTAYAREAKEKKGMDESQVTGTASSYARKYALNGLFCIDDTRDADTDEYQRQERGLRDAEEVLRRFNEPPKKIVCEECGKTVLGYKGKNGDDVTPEKHIAYTQKQFGKTLCLSCAKEQKKNK